MKRKIFSVLFALVLVLTLSLVTAVPVVAKPTTIQVSWHEDAIRYYPDDSVWTSWQNDGPFSANLTCTGKAYHFANIQEYYNQPLQNLSGKMIISGAGELSGHATYTSSWSGLPIREHFRGNVSIQGNTMNGTYTQWAYAFGSRADVLSSYPNSVPANKQGAGWWFIGYTDYIAY